MKKITLFIVILLSATCVLRAQNIDEIHQLLDLRNTKSEEIARVRRVLLDSFLEGNVEMMQTLTDFLKNELEDENYIALYRSEYWLLCYWLKDYDNLLASVLELEEYTSLKRSVGDKYSSSYSDNNDYRIRPVDDFLYQKLKQASIDSKPFLQTKLYGSELAEIEKDFLSMFLDNISSDRLSYYNTYYRAEQELLNKTADDFLAKYPNSAYEEFTRTYLRYKETTSKWGFGYDMGGGVGIFDGDISNIFGATHGSFHLNFDLAYMRLLLQGKLMFNHPTAKTDIDLGYAVWEKSQKGLIVIPEISLGFSLVDSERFRITPFGGISPWFLSPKEKAIEDNPALEDTKFNTFGYVFGLNIDYKIGDKDSYSLFRLRYGFYSSQYNKKHPEYPDLNGHLHNISLGFGVFGRQKKRAY